MKFTWAGLLAMVVVMIVVTAATDEFPRLGVWLARRAERFFPAHDALGWTSDVDTRSRQAYAGRRSKLGVFLLGVSCLVMTAPRYALEKQWRGANRLLLLFLIPAGAGLYFGGSLLSSSTKAVATAQEAQRATVSVTAIDAREMNSMKQLGQRVVGELQQSWVAHEHPEIVARAEQILSQTVQPPSRTLVDRLRRERRDLLGSGLATGVGGIGSVGMGVVMIAAALARNRLRGIRRAMGAAALGTATMTGGILLSHLVGLTTGPQTITTVVIGIGGSLLGVMAVWVLRPTGGLAMAHKRLLAGN